MKRSKIFSVLIALFLVVSMNMGLVKAAGNAKIYLDVLQAKSGIVTVTCKAEDFDKITNGRLILYYSRDKLKLEGSTVGKTWSENGFQTMINNDQKEDGRVILTAARANEADISGELLQVRFSTSDKVDLKECGLRLEVAELSNLDAEEGKQELTESITVAETQYKSELENNEGNKDDGNKDDGNKDDGNKDDGNKDEIKPAEKSDITKAEVAAIADQVYTGKDIRPNMTIKYNGKLLKEGDDYALAYVSNLNLGKAEVTIIGIGDYSGSKKVSFCIVPQAPKIKKAKSPAKHKISLKWKKVKKVDGYEIQVAKNKKFTKKVKNVLIKKGTRRSKKFKVKGKAKGKYYVRIRAYVKINGVKHYGTYSAKTLVRVK